MAQPAQAARPRRPDRHRLHRHGRAAQQPRGGEPSLKECLKHDRARIQLGRISSFGLLEMSRQRMRSSVLEATMQECPALSRHGLPEVRVLHRASSILRAVEEQMRRQLRPLRRDRAHGRGDRAAACSTPSAPSMAALEAEHGVPVVLEADAHGGRTRPSRSSAAPSSSAPSASSGRSGRTTR